MTDDSLESTCAHLDAIACIYLVYADDCVVERTTELAEALKSFRSWASQLNAALPNMGDRCSIKIVLGEK